MKRIKNGRVMSMPAGILTGVGIGLALSVGLAMILAWLIITGRVWENGIGYGAMVLVSVGTMISAIVSWRCVRHNRLKVTLLAAGGYYLAMLCIGLLFGSGFDGMGVVGAMVIAGGAISLIPALFGSSSGVRRHKIPAYR